MTCCSSRRSRRSSTRQASYGSCCRRGSSRLQWSTLALCPGSFVDEALAERFTDLLFSVMLGNSPARLYLLFEHQSTPDELMGFRLLAYEVRI